MSGRALIAVVEDDEVVAASVAALLDAHGFRAESYRTAEAFLDAATDGAATDCVLMDVRLPGLDGVEAVARFRAAGGLTPIVVVTGHADVSLAVAAMRAGAQDLLEKPYDDADLVARIEAACEAGAQELDHRRRFEALTPRETDVMREVVAGRPNKVIAHNLGLSPKTVEIHRSRVMEKTGAESLSHLVRMAFKAGIDPEASD
ncbi:MAG: response regulator [Pseudomonadota bacterium]